MVGVCGVRRPSADDYEEECKKDQHKRPRRELGLMLARAVETYGVLQMKFAASSVPESSIVAFSRK
jgi:hypothetical protein